MFARALIVLLLILNLGVALWWATRGDDAPSADELPLPRGVEPLRLLEESADPAAPARAPVTVPPGAPEARDARDQAAATAGPGPTTAATEAGETTPAREAAAAPAVATVCHSFGPFADAAAAGRAAAQLRPAVRGVATRQVRPAPRGWNVQLSALPDRAAADAAATRLSAAGFDDHYLLPAAEDGTVDIALGRFGGEAAAQRHVAALQAAGFAAVAEPIGGDGQTRHWVDVVAGEHVDPDVLRRAAGAAQGEPIECEPAAAVP
ncbi:SPOR domain-containing protein [Luteimonas viscosa]|uniref:SPOR domain-containing protein n=1 Tax=Luteimonas viscosa TaxID=1132694 RepID=A0A5D4XSK7_9GAMM|nr:SPOR domain-containing protein [Luteimonas viscosa]TYT27064.1 SPOR domain-containing protein [Luteimonas viscosa]